MSFTCRLLDSLVTLTNMWDMTSTLAMGNGPFEETVVMHWFDSVSVSITVFRRMWLEGWQIQATFNPIVGKDLVNGGRRHLWRAWRDLHHLQSLPTYCHTIAGSCRSLYDSHPFSVDLQHGNAFQGFSLFSCHGDSDDHIWSKGDSLRRQRIRLRRRWQLSTNSCVSGIPCHLEAWTG